MIPVSVERGAFRNPFAELLSGATAVWTRPTLERSQLLEAVGLQLEAPRPRSRRGCAAAGERTTRASLRVYHSGGWWYTGAVEPHRGSALGASAFQPTRIASRKTETSQIDSQMDKKTNGKIDGKANGFPSLITDMPIHFQLNQMHMTPLPVHAVLLIRSAADGPLSLPPKGERENGLHISHGERSSGVHDYSCLGVRQTRQE